jgi:rfaE bifunctional protein kinase chain/domain
MLRQKCVSLDTTWVFSRKTTQKTRFFSGGRMLLRMDHDYVCQDDEARLVYEQVCRELPHASLLVLSDYAKGALAKTQLMITAARKFNVPVLVDPKGDDWSRYYGANWIKANESEAIAAAKFHNCFPNFSMLPGNLFLDGLVVTRANRAPTVHTQEAVPWTAPHIFPKQVIDVTGGGDSYVAAMAVCLAEGAPLAHVLDFAAKAGAIAVSRAGTYVVTKEDIANVSSI